MNILHTRRQFLGLLGAATAASQLPSLAQLSAPKPNIIFILADDLGYGDLGCYGQTKIKTPNIDRLATEGTRFTDCYAGAVVCAPSRSVLMTGQHTGHTRIRANSGVNAPKHDGEEGRIPLHAEDFTVAQLLKNAGYATGITGKWGLGEPGSTGLPNDHGFDEWLGYLNQNHAPEYFTDYLWKNKEKLPIPENENGKRAKYSCDLFTDFAEDFIRRHKEHPFFLYLAYTIPHLKLEVPDLGEYANTDWPEEAKTMAAMITRLDSYVGRIAALLKELGLDENTIVFFASDNGSSAPNKDFFARCGALRAKKGSLYDGGIRAPMIARWPGKVPAGKTNNTPWYFADFLPTAGALAQVLLPSNIDGVNVLPTLYGADQPELHARFLYWESYSNDVFGQAARFNNWKAVRPSKTEPVELYDLAEDIGESHDLAHEHTELVQKFIQFIDSAHTDSPHWPYDPNRKSDSIAKNE